MRDRLFADKPMSDEVLSEHETLRVNVSIISLLYFLPWICQKKNNLSTIYLNNPDESTPSHTGLLHEQQR